MANDISTDLTEYMLRQSWGESAMREALINKGERPDITQERLRLFRDNKDNGNLSKPLQGDTFAPWWHYVSLVLYGDGFALKHLPPNSDDIQLKLIDFISSHPSCTQEEFKAAIQETNKREDNNLPFEERKPIGRLNFLQTKEKEPINREREELTGTEAIIANLHQYGITPNEELLTRAKKLKAHTTQSNDATSLKLEWQTEVPSVNLESNLKHENQKKKLQLIGLPQVSTQTELADLLQSYKTMNWKSAFCNHSITTPLLEKLTYELYAKGFRGQGLINQLGEAILSQADRRSTASSVKTPKDLNSVKSSRPHKNGKVEVIYATQDIANDYQLQKSLTKDIKRLATAGEFEKVNALYQTLEQVEERLEKHKQEAFTVIQAKSNVEKDKKALDDCDFEILTCEEEIEAIKGRLAEVENKRLEIIRKRTEIEERLKQDEEEWAKLKQDKEEKGKQNKEELEKKLKTRLTTLEALKHIKAPIDETLLQEIENLRTQIRY